MAAELLPPVAVIGGGLCGSLAALALARRGFAVTLLAPSGPQACRGPAGLLSATALSYGALAGPPSWQAWADLQRLHGPLGLRPATLLLHGGGWSDRLPPALRAWPTRLWGLGRVDPPSLLAALPLALAATGVRRRDAVVHGIEPGPAGWQLALGTPEGAEHLEVPQLVLASGAGSKGLWPGLPERLRLSWAGVLLLAGHPPGAWPAHAARGRVVQPRRWQRPQLEASAPTLDQESWIVDAGLAPRDDGLVVGQISLVRPGLSVGTPPDPGAMEQRLRRGLAGLDPALAQLEGVYSQVPVSFCVGGEPLVGPVAGAPRGLWAFTGFSAAFSRVPRQAEALAAAMAAQAGSA